MCGYIRGCVSRRWSLAWEQSYSMSWREPTIGPTFIPIELMIFTLPTHLETHLEPSQRYSHWHQSSAEVLRRGYSSFEPRRSVWWFTSYCIHCSESESTPGTSLPPWRQERSPRSCFDGCTTNYPKVPDRALPRARRWEQQQTTTLGGGWGAGPGALGHETRYGI